MVKKRIRAMAEGKFEYREIDIKVSEGRIERMATKGGTIKGDFLLICPDERKLKGMIYTTDRRMVCEHVQFAGDKVRISYEFHTEGMEEGDTNKGEIYIESNAGEIIVPYVVSIMYGAVNSSVGRIKNLFHFANLAQMDYQEAYKLFCSRKFLGVQMDEAQRLLYVSLTRNGFSKDSMEEFLVGVHKKQPVRVTLNSREEVCQCESDSFKKSVLLTKDTWGYVEIHVSSDADFITMDKSVITTEDFIGNHYNWEFIIDKKKLHEGRNCAELVFDSGIRTEKMSMIIGVPSKRDRNLQKERQLILEICRLYIDIRRHAIKESVWQKETLKRVETLSGLDGENPFYMLMRAQLYTMADKDLECCFILNKFNDIDEIKEEQPELYGYYQYVYALQKRDELHNQAVLQDVKKLSERYPHNFWLLCVRLFMDSDLEYNKSAKYRLLKEQYMYGCRSHFLYLEAALLLKKDASLMNHLDDFEQQVLLFAVRQDILSRDMVEKAAQMALGLKEFAQKVFRFLTNAYTTYGTKQCTEAVCSMLIRDSRCENEYFPWFEKGLQEGLKLTGLFEYYLYTVPKERAEVLPKTLLMYFSYDHTLDYRRKAFLYANVWKHREDIGELFFEYEPAVRIFVKEQVILRHVSDALVYLYRQLSDELLKDAETAAALEELVFVYRLTCENKHIRQVVVCYTQLEREDVFPVSNGKAWVKIFHRDAMILLEDKDGKRHLDTITYRTEPMFSETEVSKYCLKFKKDSLGLLLNRYHKRGSVLKETTSVICEKLLEKQELSKEFRQDVVRQLCDYYMDIRAYDKAEVYLLKLDFSFLSLKERGRFIEMYIARGLYREAYKIINKYGPEGISPKRLVRLCSRLIAAEQAEEDLLELTYYVFSRGKYDENMLEYLTKYFCGPNEQMDEIWRAAKRFDVDTYEIGERILQQMLFTGYLLTDSGEIFEDYYKPGCKLEIVQAYLAFFSYYYVVHEQIIDERILEWIEKECRRGEFVSRDCKMALLKYYSGMSQVADDKVELLQNLMAEFRENGVVFPFFSGLDRRVTEVFQIYEKTIVEHRAAPDKKVYIVYRMLEVSGQDAVYRREEMDRVYDSIFVKELISFYGEKIQYYIWECEEDGSNMHICASASLDNQQNAGMVVMEGRFNLLNEIAASYYVGDEESLQEFMTRYSRTEALSEELFELKE